MPAPSAMASGSGTLRGLEGGTHFPELHISRNVMGQIRTLMLCATSPSEHIANLHAVEEPSNRATSPTLSICTLSLPDATVQLAEAPIILTAGPSPYVHPRRWNALSLPLSSFVSLPDGNPVVTFQTRIRTFVFSLDDAKAFDARDGRQLAQTALGIVLTGGSSLRQGETAGLLRKRGRAFEVVLTDEGEADEGVWTLGGGHAEIWKALAGLADLRAKKRNKKLGRRELCSWVAGEITVLHFDENGAAWSRQGWMRVLCGRTGVENYVAEVREVAGRYIGRFTREGRSRQQTRTRRTGPDVSKPQRRPRASDRDIRRSHGKQVESAGRTPEVDLDFEQEERVDEVTRTLSSAGVDEEENEDEVASPQEAVLIEEDIGATGDLLESSEDDLNGSDEDRTMDAMCRKYLNVGYAEEVQRRLDRLS